MTNIVLTMALYWASSQMDLNLEQKHMVLAIANVEKGGKGLEMGVAQDYPKHPARRSTAAQAWWATRMVKNHYKSFEDIESFSRRYCPYNSDQWLLNVSYYLKKFQKVQKGS